MRSTSSQLLPLKLKVDKSPIESLDGSIFPMEIKSKEDGEFQIRSTGATRVGKESICLNLFFESNR